MKRIASLMTLGLFLLLTVASARAQSGAAIEADIPFSFTAGESKFEAGTYNVKYFSEHSMLIQSADGRTRVLVPVPLAVSATDIKRVREKLVFNKYGDEYFLAQVWLVRASNGRELYKSDAERRLRKEIKLAKTATKPQTVEVASRAIH